MEELEKLGEWWVEDRPESKVNGTLYFDPSGEAKLELQGILPEVEGGVGMDIPNFDDKEVPVIHGDLGAGQRATLMDAILISSQEYIGSDEFTEESYLVDRIFLGTHLSEDPEFSQLTLEIPNLEDWLNKPVLRRILDRGAVSELLPGEDDVQQAYAVTPPKSIEAEINGHTIELISTNHGSHQPHSVELDTYGLIRVSTGDSEPLESLVETGEAVLQYVSLGMGSGVIPKKIKVTEPDGGTKGIKIFSVLSNFDSSSNPSPADYLFRLSDVDFEQSLDRWIQHREDADIFHEHHDHLLHDPNISPAHRFLSLIITLESYHDFLFPDFELMDGEAYGDLRQQLVSEIPDDAEAKSRIDNLLGSIGNKPSLRDQLEAVIGEYEEIVPRLIDVDTTVRDARDLRHDIAHGLNATDRQETVQMAHKLDFILKSILLTEIGVDSDIAANALANRYRGHLDIPYGELIGNS